jgi:hypothetical protein
VAIEKGEDFIVFIRQNDLWIYPVNNSDAAISDTGMPVIKVIVKTLSMGLSWFFQFLFWIF